MSSCLDKQHLLPPTSLPSESLLLISLKASSLLPLPPPYPFYLFIGRFWKHRGAVKRTWHCTDLVAGTSVINKDDGAHIHQSNRDRTNESGAPTSTWRPRRPRPLIGILSLQGVAINVAARHTVPVLCSLSYPSGDSPFLPPYFMAFQLKKRNHLFRFMPRSLR